MRLHGIDAPDRRRGHLRYGRTVARCLLGELDIEAEMVRRGLAWAFVKYSRDYVAQEAEARAAHRAPAANAAPRSAAQHALAIARPVYAENGIAR